MINSILLLSLFRIGEFLDQLFLSEAGKADHQLHAVARAFADDSSPVCRLVSSSSSYREFCVNGRRHRLRPVILQGR